MNYKKILTKGIDEFNKGEYENCRRTFTSALKKFPKEIEIYTYLIPVLINQNRLEDATIHANKLYNLNKKNEVGLTYLGIIYFKQKNYIESLKFFLKSLSLQPKNHNTLLNTGIILHKLGRNSEALEYLESSIEIEPNNSMAFHNLGSIYEDESKYSQAKENFKKAISLNKQDYDSIHGLSLIQLSEGDYENGLENYEARFFISNRNVELRHRNIPRLDTLQNIEKKRVLIWFEQGMGDSIQFSRYVKLIIKLKAEVTFEVQEPLVSFFERQLNCKVVKHENSNNFDYQIPLLSLPRLFKTNINNIPKIDTYLESDKQKYVNWKDHLSLSNQKLNVGIAISGNPNHIKDKRRSIDLKKLLNLRNYCKLYLIQKELYKEDMSIVRNCDDILFLGDNKSWIDFNDTCAIVDNMDLIISIDTSLIHLAGSMNKKSILLLSKPADWRWTENFNKIPNWYNSLLAIRQSEKNTWDLAVKEIENFIKSNQLN